MSLLKNTLFKERIVNIMKRCLNNELEYPDNIIANINEFYDKDLSGITTEDLDRAFDALKEKYSEDNAHRRVNSVKLFYKQHLTIKYIARMKMISPTTVSNDVHKVLRDIIFDKEIYYTLLNEPFPQFTEDSYIHDTFLSTRVKNSLSRYICVFKKKRWSDVTIKDVLIIPFDELVKIRNFGIKGFEELNTFLEKHGMHLKQCEFTKAGRYCDGCKYSKFKNICKL